MDEHGYKNVMRSLIDYNTSDKTIYECIYLSHKCMTQRDARVRQLDLSYNEFRIWATAYEEINGLQYNSKAIRDTIVQYNSEQFPCYHVSQCMFKAFINKAAKLFSPNVTQEKQYENLYILSMAHEPCTISKMIYVIPEI